MMPSSPLLEFPPLLNDVRHLLPEDLTVYLVGGAVRDALLRRPVHDLDFALAEGGIALARRIAKGLGADFYPLDPERDTGRVIAIAQDGGRMVLDFAALRGPDLAEDLLGRDFTVNAIALDVRSGEIFDPLGGARDLKDKCLRACSPSAFADDPLRILRAVRQAAELDFHIQQETRSAMKTASVLLGDASPERLRDELFRILEGPRPAVCLRALDLLGALEPVLPELPALKGVDQPAPHVHDVWEHTLAVVSRLEAILDVLAPGHDPDRGADLYNGLLSLRLGRYRQEIRAHFASAINVNRSLRGLLFFAALFHDVAKPDTLQVDEVGQVRFWGHDQQGAAAAAARARTLALSNDEIERLEAVVRNHMRVLFHTTRLLKEKREPSRRAIYRFFRAAGPAGVELCLLALADLRATYEQTLPQETWSAGLDVVRLLLENWFEKRDESIAPPPVVNGDELMLAFTLPPGPRIGELLEAIREAQAMGQVTTKKEALALAREKNTESSG
ncbi:MAG: CCA tRNA nucleotidyltransferase [Anaerolineales bacterium]|nr:CCA tRNA nucleotidyltransferase [Anaerolineales bacterium]